MTTLNTILHQQRDWAVRRNLPLDPIRPDYVIHAADSLFLKELSPPTRRAFEKGAGDELTDQGKKPAKIRALRSSAALLANVFDYWSASPLTAALGFNNGLFDIEAIFPTGLKGTSPQLDVATIR